MKFENFEKGLGNYRKNLTEDYSKFWNRPGNHPDNYKEILIPVLNFI